MIRLTVSPNKVIKILSTLILFLVVFFAIGQIAKHIFGYGWLKGFVPMFDLNKEANIPTWYSSSALLLAFLLLWLIGNAKKESADPYLLHWRVLSLVFFYLSVDEAAQIHELATEPMRDFLDMSQASGFLHHTWIIAGLAFLVVFGVIFIPFLRHLPKRSLYFFLASGIIFVLGAIVLESVSGSYLGYAEYVNDHWTVLNKQEDLVYSAIYFLEELCEMIGIVLFIFSLFDYIRNHLGGISVNIESSSSKRSA